MSRAIVLAMCFAASVQAQEPARPPLPPAADTNAAASYLDWGESMLQGAPDSAAAAFYWAARIEPTNGDAFYARWVALQLRDPGRAWDHERRDKSTLSDPAVRRTDSLELRALMLSPLAYRTMDRGLVMIALAHEAPAPAPASPAASGPPPGAGRPGMQGFTRTPGGAAPPPTPRPPKLDAALQGWAAYSRGEFLPALTDYGQALSTTSAPWAIHAERGRIQYLLSHPDSASAELALAANAIAKNEHPELAYVYESAAVYEYSRGFALEATHRDSARAAYEHALALDPSFAAAHVRLSALALTRGDTAASLGQLDLAAHEAPGDVVIAYLNARALAQAGYAAECEAELKRAIGLEPWFAAPQLMLALLYDASGLKPQAAAAFARYVAIARKNDPNLPRARERLAALSAAPTPP